MKSSLQPGTFLLRAPLVVCACLHGVLAGYGEAPRPRHHPVPRCQHRCARWLLHGARRPGHARAAAACGACAAAAARRRRRLSQRLPRGGCHAAALPSGRAQALRMERKQEGPP